VVDADTTGELADGVRRADELADGGCDLLLAGADLDPVPGLVALAAVLSLEPVKAVGTRAGPEWARRRRACATGCGPQGGGPASRPSCCGPSAAPR
jgi:hypothetical protein